MPIRKELLIGGRWAAPEAGDTLEVVNPRTEEVTGQAPIASRADVHAAVTAAKAAFTGPWAGLSFTLKTPFSGAERAPAAPVAVSVSW